MARKCRVHQSPVRREGLSRPRRAFAVAASPDARIPPGGEGDTLEAFPARLSNGAKSLIHNDIPDERKRLRVARDMPGG